MPHRPWRLRPLVGVVGFGGATSSGSCVGGGCLLSVISKRCNVIGVQYTRIYARSYGD